MCRTAVKGLEFRGVIPVNDTVSIMYSVMQKYIPRKEERGWEGPSFFLVICSDATAPEINRKMLVSTLHKDV